MHPRYRKQSERIDLLSMETDKYITSKNFRLLTKKNKGKNREELRGKNGGKENKVKREENEGKGK